MLALLFAGCSSRTPMDRLDEPLFGHHHETTFQLEAHRTVDVQELARMAKIVRVYKELKPDEIALISKRLSEALDELIAVEVQALEPQMAPVKARMEARHRVALDGAQGDERKTARIVADHQIAMQRLEQQRLDLAKKRVLDRLGKDLALPLLTSDNRSVVAFGKVNGEQLQVTSKAYEIDVTAADLPPGAKVVTGGSRTASVVGEATARIAPPSR